MIRFDPNDPYPLLAEESYTYREAQAHAAEVDEWLGLRVAETEMSLLQAFERAKNVPASERSKEGSPARDEQAWIGLPSSALLTPYVELRGMLDRLSPIPGQTVVDLGAAYGRLAFVLRRHYPGIGFRGFELLEPRVAEGNRALENSEGHRLQTCDLSSPDFAPPPADFYFLYDFGSRAAIEKTLQDLRRIAQTRPIIVIGRGRASRDAIERGHPWLSQVHETRHYAHYSIYRG